MILLKPLNFITPIINKIASSILIYYVRLINKTACEYNRLFNNDLTKLINRGELWHRSFGFFADKVRATRCINQIGIKGDLFHIIFGDADHLIENIARLAHTERPIIGLVPFSTK